MPITFTCPECSQLLDVSDESAGLYGSCPKCAVTIRFPHSSDPPSVTAVTEMVRPAALPAALERVAPAARERDWGKREELDEPLPMPSGWERPVDIAADLPPRAVWRSTYTGLTLTRCGVITLLFVALAILLIFVEWTTRFQAARVPALGLYREAVLLVASGVAVLAFLLILAGQMLCCTVPRVSGGRGFAIFSFVFVLLVVFAIVIAVLVLVNQARNPRRSSEVVLFVSIGVIFAASVLVIVSHVLFVLFLKMVGRYFDNQSLSRRTTWYLIFYVVYVAINHVDSGISATVPETSRHRFLVSCIVGGIYLASSLVQSLWFLDLMGRAQKSIIRGTNE